MARESLNFKYNACAIDVKVAGFAKIASGFVFRTTPSCDYDYVLTAKHTFQEKYEEEPKVAKLSDLSIRYDSDSKDKIELYDIKDLGNSLLFIGNLDMTIIRIKKQYISSIKRIMVKNAADSHDDDLMKAHAYIKIQRGESTPLNCEWSDRERGTVKIDDIKDIHRYKGASGCGIYSNKGPYLIGLLSGYRLPHFEQNELTIVKPDWNKVNILLRAHKWVRLNEGRGQLTCITKDKEVIDLRELTVNGAMLNMETAVKRMKHDLIDDWFFDPLRYADMCNNEFVLDFFSMGGHRHNYYPQKMEVFYLPKKTYVLRKAMVGTFMDRLLYMAVVSQLGPLIDSHFSCYVYSARYNTDKSKNGLIVQGVEQWTKMNYLINDWVTTAADGCLVKLDLLNYYDTINTNILIKMLNTIVDNDNDRACVKLLDTLLSGFTNKETNHGIPQNSDASSLLATFYVSHVDFIIQSKARHFCRFMDDMYFVAKDIYEARDLLQTIEKHLREIDLSLNAQKIKFVQLDDKEKKELFLKELSLYDHEKSMIKSLIKSSSKSRRMNALALLMNQLGKALKSKEVEKDDELRIKDRALKFSVYTFSSLNLQLDSYWDKFYQNLETLTEELVDIPDHTPMICQLISSIGRWRDIKGITNAVKGLLLRKIGSIYEWQAYQLWMLMAYLHYNDDELERYAVEEIEKNDETRRVELAAMIIYIATINLEHSRGLILPKLRNGQLHGNLQHRCALIALRTLGHQVVDKEVSKSINNDALCLCHLYLHKHKDKPLVFFHKISSFLMEHNEPIIPEFYSGL